MISTCTARKVYTLTHDAATNREFILATNQFAKTYTDTELDSLDLGDAMGFWMTHLDSLEWSGDNDSGDMTIPMDTFLITISYTWEPFSWTGMPGDPIFLSDPR